MAAPVRAALLGNLVADAPHNHAGMVAVAAHHVAQVALAPLVEILAVAVGNLGDAPHVEGLVHHHQAHAVAQLQQLRRRRIVAGADGVDARALEDFQLPFGGPAVHRHSQRAQIGVIAHALNLVGLAVQQEALFLVEGDGTDAEGRLVTVHHFPVFQHLADQRIEVRTVHVPALRMADGERGGLRLAAIRRDGHRVVAAGDGLAGGVQNLAPQYDRGGRTGPIAQLGFHRDGGAIGARPRASSRTCPSAPRAAGR